MTDPLDAIHLTPYTPADRDWLVERHQTLYSADEGFDGSFGPLVHGILEHYELSHDPAFEAGWIARRGAEPVGSIFCVRHSAETAKLRLFLIAPEARGQGLGKRLLMECMGFARDVGYQHMTLWTHESHKAACGLYNSFGWVLTTSKQVRSFGVDLVEQQWDISLNPPQKGLAIARVGG